MEEQLFLLNNWSIGALLFLFLLENSLVAFSAIILGFLIDGDLKGIHKRISKTEVLWAISTVFFNTFITFAGYELFKHHFVVFDFSTDALKIFSDFVLLILCMDLLMYVFHFIIHRISFIYKYHDLHHYYSEPTAISLFVLHPVEVMGFGTLWLSLICMMSFSFYATMLYLVFNVGMGLIGHLQKEVVPDVIKHNKYFKWLATTSFHRDHHSCENYNFGFYTSLWDRLFGTFRA